MKKNKVLINVRGSRRPLLAFGIMFGFLLVISMAAMIKSPGTNSYIVVIILAIVEIITFFIFLSFSIRLYSDKLVYRSLFGKNEIKFVNVSKIEFIGLGKSIMKVIYKSYNKGFDVIQLRVFKIDDVNKMRDSLPQKLLK